MASPFDIFRKHQRGAMATLVLLAMFSFIVLGTIDMGGGSRGGSGQSSDAVIGTWKFGNITQGDIEQRMADRVVVNAFLGGINHLATVHRAMADGVPLKGYFLWSFIDNFEWEDGYQRRFGIVHCDFKTQKRTPKLSARYYSDVIQERKIL